MNRSQNNYNSHSNTYRSAQFLELYLFLSSAELVLYPAINHLPCPEIRMIESNIPKTITIHSPADTSAKFITSPTFNLFVYCKLTIQKFCQVLNGYVHFCRYLFHSHSRSKEPLYYHLHILSNLYEMPIQISIVLLTGKFKLMKEGLY